MTLRVDTIQNRHRESKADFRICDIVPAKSHLQNLNSIETDKNF